jgi:hypothetical protein
MNQVHKEQLSAVENSLPNRQSLDVEIFGMEGIPDEIIASHNTRVLQQFYEAQAERRAKSGNPAPGEAAKRQKINSETPEELRARLAEWRAHKMAGGGAPQPVADVEAEDAAAPPPGVVVAAGVSYGVGAPPGMPPGMPPGIAAPPGLAAPPPSLPAVGLPQRPTFNAPVVPPLQMQQLHHGQPSPFGAYTQAAPGAPPGLPAGVPGGGDEGTAQAVDELIASAAQQGAAKEKKGAKKVEKARMVYSDNEVSPEEKLAMLARYAVVS